MSQRYSEFAAVTSGRGSGAATIANVLAGPCLAPGGQLWTSVTIRVESGGEAVVQVPGVTWGKDRAQLTMTNALVSRSVLPQGELDDDVTDALAAAPIPVCAAVSLGCMQLGAAAHAESAVEYVEQVEESQQRSRLGYPDGEGLTVRGRVPIVAAALGTTPLLAAVGLAPTKCESLSEYVATMSTLHSGASAADDSSASTLLEAIGVRAARVPDTAVILTVSTSFKSALKKLKGLETPADAGSEPLLRELVSSITALPNVAGVFVVAMAGVPPPHLGVPNAVVVDARLRTPRDTDGTAPANLTLRAAVDVSSLRTVSQVVAAAASASVLVVPRHSPFASPAGATVAVGLRNVSMVALRQPFSECIAYLNTLAAIGDRDYVGTALADLLASTPDDQHRPALRRRVSRRRRTTTDGGSRPE